MPYFLANVFIIASLICHYRGLDFQSVSFLCSGGIMLCLGFVRDGIVKAIKEPRNG